MKLVAPEIIRRIDRFAEERLGISTLTLMERSGEAVRLCAKRLLPNGGRVAVLAGKGNNGGDGYAFAVLCGEEFDLTVYDVFSSGQRSEAGKHFLNEYVRGGGKLSYGIPKENELSSFDLIVDAIFGTGMSGELSDELSVLAERINSLGKKVLAVDIPLGVDGEWGRAEDRALRADMTAALSFMKVGTLSYPAREYMGEIVPFDLSLPEDIISSEFVFKDIYLDENEAVALLPERKKNGNKGSFGKALLITGSEAFEGAGRLSLEACLRGGAGISSFVSARALRDRLIASYPEAIYHPLLDDPTNNAEKIAELSAKHSATLIGSGSGVSEELFLIVKRLLSTEGGPLILDADAINSLAKYGTRELLKNACRKLILTPHPLEFSRISEIPVERINSDRLYVAKGFAKEYNLTLLLKGASTVVTDGDRAYINSTGSTALSKGGSGDALAGLLVSLLSFSSDTLGMAALSAYVHGRAGDALSADRKSVV